MTASKGWHAMTGGEVVASAFPTEREGIPWRDTEQKTVTTGADQLEEADGHNDRSSPPQTLVWTDRALA